DRHYFSISSRAGKYQDGIDLYKNLDGYDDIWYSYELRFHKDFDFKWGGKLSGVRGTGSGNAQPNGCDWNYYNSPRDNGYSMRTMFRGAG
ncbi:MAG: polysaccharide lyase, partial [Psychromonas sp.]